MANQSFTTVATGRRNSLKNEVSVSDVVKPGSTLDEIAATKAIKAFAIWDTGATGSVITPKIANDLGLKPIGKTEVHTAGGTHVQNEYMICLHLPNSIGVNVRVTEANIFNDEILIGMDVIGLGDFAVTNFNDNTIFSFRIPSQEVFDFTGNLDSKGIMRKTETRAEKRRRERELKKGK